MTKTPTTPDPSHAKGRVSFVLPVNDITALRLIMREMGYDSPAQLVVRALRVFFHIYRATKHGDTLLTRDKHGQETNLLLL